MVSQDRPAATPRRTPTQTWRCLPRSPSTRIASTTRFVVASIRSMTPPASLPPATQRMSSSCARPPPHVPSRNRIDGDSGDDLIGRRVDPDDGALRGIFAPNGDPHAAAADRDRAWVPTIWDRGRHLGRRRWQGSQIRNQEPVEFVLRRLQRVRARILRTEEDPHLDVLVLDRGHEPVERNVRRDLPLPLVLHLGIRELQREISGGEVGYRRRRGILRMIDPSHQDDSLRWEGLHGPPRPANQLPAKADSRRSASLKGTFAAHVSVRASESVGTGPVLATFQPDAGPKVGGIQVFASA